MKTTLVLFTISTSLMLAVPELLVQNTNASTNVIANSIPLTETVKYQAALEHDRSLGERSLLPPGLKEKMKLTKAQRIELRQYEPEIPGYQQTSYQYLPLGNPSGSHIEGPSPNSGGAHPVATDLGGAPAFRVDAVTKIKPLMTPDQLKILEAAENQWNENHADEANDPSAN